MLDRGNYDLSRPGSACSGNAQDCKIVGLGPAGGENQAVGLGAGKICAQDGGNFFPGVLQCPMRTLARPMLAGRIGVALGITPHHGLNDLGPSGSGGIMIKIYWIHLLSIQMRPMTSTRPFWP